MLDDDSVQVIVAFDIYQFSGSFYSRSGPALHMLPKWADLRRFYDALLTEFAASDATHGVLHRAVTEERNER